MRDDFDPNWPHGHVTKRGYRIINTFPPGCSECYLWVEFPNGDHRLTNYDGFGQCRDPDLGRGFDLVNAPAPASAPRDETAALKARIAELEAKVAALEPEPASGVVWVNINRADSGKIWPGLPEISLLHADTCASSERIARVRVEWKEGQFDE